MIRKDSELGLIVKGVALVLAVTAYSAMLSYVLIKILLSWLPL